MLLKRKTTKCDHVEKFTKYLINKRRTKRLFCNNFNKLGYSNRQFF